MEKIKELINQLDLRNKIGWLLYIFLSVVMWIIRPFLLNIPVVTSFYTKEGSSAYIYRVLDYVWANSNWVGRASGMEQLTQYLPLYNRECIFTYIAMSCGKLVSIVSGLMLVMVVIACIVICRRHKSIITNVIAVFLVQAVMVIVVMLLQNWGMMPFVY